VVVPLCIMFLQQANSPLFFKWIQDVDTSSWNLLWFIQLQKIVALFLTKTWHLITCIYVCLGEEGFF
jgi:hypothetical protein